MSLSTFIIKQHDTHTAMVATLRDSAGNPINLTGATVKFIMKSAAGVVKAARQAEVHGDPAGGVVWVVFQAAEVDTAGFFRSEFEVTYPDESVETFPNTGYQPISIEPDLG